MVLAPFCFLCYHGHIMNTRVNVYFPQAVYQELEALSEEKGMSKPGFIKHIFELYKIFLMNKDTLLTKKAGKNKVYR